MPESYTTQVTCVVQHQKSVRKLLVADDYTTDALATALKLTKAQTLSVLQRMEEAAIVVRRSGYWRLVKCS